MIADIPTAGWGTLAALVGVIAVCGWLGAAAERAVRRGSFMRTYFLGNRGLGVWTLALTATVQSGGTFMGFPSLVYTHGWIVALWIGSYLLVPLTGFAVLGKRLADLSRRLDGITVPDLFRGRFNSPALGLVASLLIIFFMAAMTVAQFKAGALIMKNAWPGMLGSSQAPVSDSTSPTAGDANAVASETSAAIGATAKTGPDAAYLIGLAVFTVVVVGYTAVGGFLASVWADLFQSVLMVLGVVALLVMVLVSPEVGGMQQATMKAVEHTGPGYASGPGYSPDGREFLPLGLAISFFFVWVWAGMASPASIVRVMACNSTAAIRRSIIVLGIYNTFIYMPLVIICVAARAIMPDLRESDEVVPQMALWLSRDLPLGSWITGLVLAAPFGAVMATVSTFLVVIASGLVRDVYQRFFRPLAGEKEIRTMTYAAMVLVGVVAVALNVQPVKYLQAIVVFCASGQAAAFLAPAVMACYWRRATAAGTLAAMIAGGGTVIALFLVGFRSPDPRIGNLTEFRPYFLLGLEPIVWGIAASIVTGIVVSLFTQPPDKALVSRLFDEQ